jgi:hypothetical protein
LVGAPAFSGGSNASALREKAALQSIGPRGCPVGAPAFMREKRRASINRASGLSGGSPLLQQGEAGLQRCGKELRFNQSGLGVVRWEPPASAGGAGLWSSGRKLDPKMGFSPGISPTLKRNGSALPSAAPASRRQGSGDDDSQTRCHADLVLYRRSALPHRDTPA